MGTVDFDGRDAIAYWLRRDLNEANTRVAAMQGEREAANNLIAELQAQLSTLRPYADIGRDAVRYGWWKDTGPSGTSCMACNGWRRKDGWYHTPDCPIPALLAQLE